MPRTHEDRQKHVAVDHRSGGGAIAFQDGAWCAVMVAHVAADRVDAGISAYETLIEKARTSNVHARTSCVLRSKNDRRVITLVGLDGHAEFRHLAAAWDDHHLTAEHHDVVESSTLRLYRVAADAGELWIETGSADAFVLEHVARDPKRVRPVIEHVAAAPGFQGTTLFGSDDGHDSILLYRSDHVHDVVAFRASVAALDFLGGDDIGETFYTVHPVKTFA